MGFIVVPDFISMYEGSKINKPYPINTMITIFSYKYWFILMIIPVLIQKKYLSKVENINIKYFKIKLILMFSVFYILLVCFLWFITNSLYAPILNE